MLTEMLKNIPLNRYAVLNNYSFNNYYCCYHVQLVDLWCSSCVFLFVLLIVCCSLELIDVPFVAQVRVIIITEA